MTEQSCLMEALQDTALPQLKSALAPAIMQRHFKEQLKGLCHRPDDIHLEKIEMLRHKPGRRCLIEYTLKIGSSDLAPETLVLLGKTRSRHTAIKSVQLLERLWDAGFSAESEGDFSVPEPMGFISELQLWFQRKVKGSVASDLLALPQGRRIVEQAAEAAHQLHQAKVESNRVHTLENELDILFEKLPLVTIQHPASRPRIDRILAALLKLSREIPTPKPCGIHRDYYADQIIVAGQHLTLIDFDLYCLGDPALDIGNFIGHITEQSLRLFGDAEALSELEVAMENRFIALSGEALRPSVKAYSLLTLARHIYLSTRFPDRQHLTQALITLCEHRLGL